MEIGDRVYLIPDETTESLKRGEVEMTRHNGTICCVRWDGEPEFVHVIHSDCLAKLRQS